MTFKLTRNKLVESITGDVDSYLYIYRIHTVNKSTPKISEMRDRVEQLNNELRCQFNLPMEILLNCQNDMVCLDGPGDEWMQFSFRFQKRTGSIILKYLMLPKDFRRKGIGTYCVNWLKSFCQEFRFPLIVLGSLEKAEPFWEKMGFRPVEYEIALPYGPE